MCERNDCETKEKVRRRIAEYTFLGLTYRSMVKGGSKIGSSLQLGSESRGLLGVQDESDFYSDQNVPPWSLLTPKTPGTFVLLTAQVPIIKLHLP